MRTVVTPGAEASELQRTTDRDSGLKHWPLHRESWEYAAAAWVVLTAIFLAIGLLIVHVLEDGAFGRFDVRVSEWFADQRTPQREDLAQIGAGLSDTFYVIPVCAVLVAFFAWRFRRWHESILVVGALLYEKSIFLPVTMITDRERPPIGQLDGNPPSSSYFSGHVAAAVALYFGLWLVVRWHTDSRPIRALAAVVASAAVIAVALSRMLLGMHYLSDVVIGAIVGALALVVVDRALHRSASSRKRQSSDSAIPTASSTP